MLNLSEWDIIIFFFNILMENETIIVFLTQKCIPL